MQAFWHSLFNVRTFSARQGIYLPPHHYLLSFPSRYVLLSHSLPFLRSTSKYLCNQYAPLELLPQKQRKQNNLPNLSPKAQQTFNQSSISLETFYQHAGLDKRLRRETRTSQVRCRNLACHQNEGRFEPYQGRRLSQVGNLSRQVHCRSGRSC